MLLVPLFAFCAFIFDDGPPAVPPDPVSEVIDCQNLEVIDAFSNSSRLNFTISVGKFIRYPEQTAIRFLHAVIKVGAISSEYSFHTFWDVVPQGNNFTFSILHPILGPSQASLYCGTRLIRNYVFEPVILERLALGWSRILSASYLVGRFADVCYQNETIHLFQQGRTSIRGMALATGFAIPIEVHQTVLSMVSLPFPTVFISANPTAAWRILLDVLLPTWAAVFEFPAGKHIRTVFTRNQFHLTEFLRPLVGEEFLGNTISGCFSDATFTRASGSLNVIEAPQVGMTEVVGISYQLTWLMTINPSLLQLFRAVYTNRTAKPLNVFLDPHTLKYRTRLQKLFPAARFRRWPPSDNFTKIVQRIAESQVFFSSHISSMLFAVFMGSNSSIIDFQPEGLGCTGLGEKLAAWGKARYLPIRKSATCACLIGNVTCYLEQRLVYASLSNAELKAIFDAAFKTAMS